MGYGPSIPKIVWPNKARLALNFVLNYEEGAESCVLEGDAFSEHYLTDLPLSAPLKGERHLSVESLFEYGSRRGVWRLLELFEAHSIPLTVFATGMALEKNLPLAKTLKKSAHEVAGHGYRWIDYREVPEAVEREHIQKTLNIIQTLCGKKATGWYTGRRSKNTRALIVEAGLKYDSESYADDLPYWVEVKGKEHLVIPYQLDTNDARYVMSPGWTSGNDYFEYLKASFECLYREGSTFPKMMTVGVHARLSGRPGRAEALHRFIQFIKQFDDIWICKREEIAHELYNQKNAGG